MNEELDLNKLALDFVQANLDRLLAAAGSGVKGAKNVVRSKLKRTYEKYLTRLLERHSKAKSFFIRSEPTPLYQFFVPLDLSTEKRTLEKASIASMAAVSGRCVVSGSGGCGKTILMRHLLVGCIKSTEKTPVFVELRQLNQDSGDLRESVLASLRAHGLDVDHDYLSLALEEGHFCLLLDGFDELELKLRKPVADQIGSLGTKYPKNWIVVSSRPDSELNTLDDFVHFHVDPLNLEAAVELVQKLPFDDPLKTRFVDDLKAGLFEKHRSFLSNPLLLSIMLLTYSDIAHIPSKLSLFYNQAYESLYQKHDALKSGFQRQRRTTLDIQDFAAAFAAFCIQSYDKRDFTFSRTSALEYLDSGKALCQLEYNSSDLLEDSLQAVCLLLEDGLDIAFAHRSFQEFFAARFIAGCQPAQKKKLVERYWKSAESDSVMDLLYEMDAHAVETYYVLPVIRRITQRTGFHGKLGYTQQLAYVKMMFQEFRIEREPRDVSALLKEKGVPDFMALFFMDRHFGLRSAKADKGWSAAARDLLRVESGGKDRLSTAVLTTESPFLRHLMSALTMYSLNTVKVAAELGKAIEARQKKAQASLAELLG